MKKSVFHRLTKSIKPTRYNIELSADLKKFTITGKLQVDLQILNCKLKKITLHSAEIEFQSVQLVQCDASVLVPTFVFNALEETVDLQFSENIKRGCSRLEISYSGLLNDKLMGFYRSRYIDQDGTEKYEAVTQFAPTAARKCFPCWDEPDFKATFDLTIIASSSFTVLTNMPVKSCCSKENTQKVVFDTSPVMSSYLVAIVIGEYDFLEDRTSAGVLVRVYTPVSKSEQGLFALNIAKKALEFYENYFQISYPLPKLDLVAVRNFSAGAMENWGLITYRETTLLIDPKRSGVNDKIRVAGVVCHELAHMWFGNLVTMSWWDDLWLNEGYASFVQYMATDYIIPEYNFWTIFIARCVSEGFALDALTNSHPIEMPIDNPNQIDELFDSITYRKGASVIKMLHNYLGVDDFRTGMCTYLNRHKYQNTKTADLWAALEEVSKKPVGSVMTTWTKQTGFPFITVDEEHENDKRVLHLSQTKFCSNGKPDPNNTLWKIPITISTAKNPSDVIVSLLLEDETLDVTIPDMSANDWVKLNTASVGFYRVLYQFDNYQRFKSSILDQTMPAADRIGIIMDLYGMVKVGYKPAVDILEMLSAYTNETDSAVWTCIRAIILYLGSILSHTSVIDKFNEFVRNLIKNTYNMVGWNIKPGESELDNVTRTAVLHLLVKSDDPECIRIAKSKYKCMLCGSTEMQGDFKVILFTAVAKHANEDDYLSLVNHFKTTQSAEDRVKILLVLGATENKLIQEKALKFCMSGEVSSQDLDFGLFSIASTPAGAELTWNYYKEHYKEILNNYTKGDYNLKNVIKSITHNFVTSEKANEIEEFFQKHPVPEVERTVKQSIEAILVNEEWIRRDLSAIEAFLK